MFIVLDQLKTAYYQGELILNANSIEKLMIYLDPSALTSIAAPEKKVDKVEEERLGRRAMRIHENIVKRNKLKVD